MTRYNNNVIRCDLCGRQIVSYSASNNYYVGPTGYNIGFGKYCCSECYPDYLSEEEQWNSDGVDRI